MKDAASDVAAENKVGRATVHRAATGIGSGRTYDKAAKVWAAAIERERAKRRQAASSQSDNLPKTIDAVAAENKVGRALPRKPRMADFAVWATAAEEAFGWPEGTALKAYAENRAEAVELGIESDAVAFTVCELLKHKPDGFEGTMTELLDELEDHASDKMRNAKTWPGSARSLSNRLRRSSTALRQVGIEVEYCRDKHKRTVCIAPLDSTCKVASPSSPSSPSEKTAQPSIKTDDANDDASMFGNGVCVTDDARVTQDDARVTQDIKVASSKKPHNKGILKGDDVDDVDDARKHTLSAAEGNKASEVFEL